MKLAQEIKLYLQSHEATRDQFGQVRGHLQDRDAVPEDAGGRQSAIGRQLLRWSDRRNLCVW